MIYAVLSLTLVRMLPVALSLAGTHVPATDRLFIGWFGPRGLASIVFGVIVFGADLPGGGTIQATIVCTVLFSVFAHGVTANPLVRALAPAWRARARRGPRSGTPDDRGPAHAPAPAGGFSPSSTATSSASMPATSPTPRPCRWTTSSSPSSSMPWRLATSHGCRSCSPQEHDAAPPNPQSPSRYRGSRPVRGGGSPAELHLLPDSADDQLRPL